MANWNGVNNLANQPGPTRVPISGGDGGGNERNYYDEYVCTGAEAVGDTLQMGPEAGGLLQGDRVQSVSLVCDDLGNGAQLKVGDPGNAARFISAVAAHPAIASPQGINTGKTGFGWQVDQDRVMTITFLGAVPAAGAKIQISWKVNRS